MLPKKTIGLIRLKLINIPLDKYIYMLFILVLLLCVLLDTGKHNKLIINIIYYIYFKCLYRDISP